MLICGRFCKTHKKNQENPHCLSVSFLTRNGTSKGSLQYTTVLSNLFTEVKIELFLALEYLVMGMMGRRRAQVSASKDSPLLATALDETTLARKKGNT